MATQPIDYQTYSRIVDQADALVHKSGKGLTRASALRVLTEAYPRDTTYADAERRYNGRTRARAVVAKVVPVRKVEAAATPVYNELKLQGDALFRAGLAGSTWEGMGMYASSHDDVYQAYVAECRRGNGQPDARLTKAMAALTPPRSAADTLMAQIAARQAAAPGLRVADAWTPVMKENPELRAQYERDARYPSLRGQPMPPQADPAPTYEAILAMADARVTKAAGLSRRAALIALVQEHPQDQAYYEAYRKYHVTDGLADHHAAGRAQGRAD